MQLFFVIITKDGNQIYDFADIFSSLVVSLYILIVYKEPSLYKQSTEKKKTFYEKTIRKIDTCKM